MKKNQPLRLALIGAGAISQTHAMALKRTALCRLVAVCDVNEQAAKSLASPYGAAHYGDYQSLLQSGGFDAAILCTPPHSHPEIAVELLERGIHVLCEKPLAIRLDLAEKMFHASQVSGAKLTMASKFRHVDDVRSAKSLVDSGMIGEVVLFENMFTANVDMRQRWNSQPEISGGGVLIDNGTHSVDIMRYFLGPLVDLQVIEGKRLQTPRVEDTVKIFVRSADGVLGDIDLSWSIQKGQAAYINLYGSEGTIMVGWKESKYRRAQDKDWTVFGHGYDKVQAFTDQLDNFALGIHGIVEFVVRPEDALASVQVIETAYQALEDSRWHRIPTLLAEHERTPQATTPAP